MSIILLYLHLTIHKIYILLLNVNLHVIIYIGKKLQPIPVRGYWIDKTDLDYSDDLLKCERKTCEANFDKTFESCWDLSDYVYDDNDIINEYGMNCESDHIQCIEGSGGPLCGTCLDGYAFSSVKEKCLSCKMKWWIEDFDLIFTFIIVITFIYFARRFHYQLILKDGDTLDDQDGAAINDINIHHIKQAKPSSSFIYNCWQYFIWRVLIGLETNNNSGVIRVLVC